VAVVCASARDYREVTAALRAMLGVAAARIVAVPTDRALVSGGPFDMDRLRPATREAYLELAALATQPPR
jgi:MinD-like ATPase involved in chromosome partitioning or flagellar assembly